jgi:hypothetical protein
VAFAVAVANGYSTAVGKAELGKPAQRRKSTGAGGAAGRYPGRESRTHDR